MRTSAWLLWMLVVPALAFAAKPPVEASMVLEGTITVNPDGSVRGYTIQKKDEVPAGVLQIVQRTVSGWQFVPITVGGKAVVAKAGMALRVVGRMTDEKHLAVRIADASFGCNSYQAISSLPNACPPGMEVEAIKRPPPRYPSDALYGGAEGEVLLLVDIARDGRVIHAAAKQVNLYHLPRRDPAVMRESLAKASVAAAQAWKFKPPTIGPKADQNHWVVVVPVRFTLSFGDGPTHLRARNHSDSADQEYGKWSAYLPGPTQHVPWAGKADGSAGSVVAGSAPFVSDSRFVLKTPLERNFDQS